MNYSPVKIIFILLGFITLGIGMIGIVVPVLPTTPFLLLSSFCFAKGSKKFHDWFCSTKIYQNHLDSFVKSRSMTLKTKIKILIPASLMLLLALYFTPFIHGKIAIVCVILFKYYYFIFRIRTIKEEETASPETDIKSGNVDGSFATKSETLGDYKNLAAEPGNRGSYQAFAAKAENLVSIQTFAAEPEHLSSTQAFAAEPNTRDSLKTLEVGQDA